MTLKDFYIDDLYVCDGQRTSNNDFLVSASVPSNARLGPPEPALVERERGAEMLVIEG